MAIPLVWQVVWVDADGRGVGACGHRHMVADDAFACPFEPTDAPVTSVGLVREVRDPEAEPERELAARRAPRQLELALGSA